MIPETVETTVTIQSQHCARTWHASLPNGRSVMAFRSEEDAPILLDPGTQVPARLTVADFSRAELLV
ncbi:hypothetical protein EI77_03049 [Prosthecobacter fusiformis]|uniref:Uncharacterized protein n=1 Tax=Prosthecobacter fusiformis TaxID=48464 RepID=A0A4R7RWN5_9BACT|nr:hypothetical protein [Prosthecobacter fusiformis]TDU69396.1 hypothetical protein EI77_03049 [Prosthecobacter fusiformis]